MDVLGGCSAGDMVITDVACGGPAIITEHEPPSQTDVRGNFSVALWNICSIKNGGLEGSLQEMESLGVNIGILQETKLTKGIYTRHYSNYSGIATDANSVSHGRVALVWRDNNRFKVKEVKKHGPNVLTFQLVTGWDHFFIVGAYIPPSDLNVLEEVTKAWQQCPNGCLPIFVGDQMTTWNHPWVMKEAW